MLNREFMLPFSLTLLVALRAYLRTRADAALEIGRGFGAEVEARIRK
jgi:hypothetical protein